MMRRTKCGGLYCAGGPSTTTADSPAAAAVFRSGGAWSNGFWGRGQGDRVQEGIWVFRPFSKLFLFLNPQNTQTFKGGARGGSV
jgi:hypothetical protein